MSDKLAELIFPEIKLKPEDYEAKYPPRNLPEGARVTRIAPSPTGYLHMGVLFASLIDYRTALDSKGVFYLRLEDTDKKREVEGGADDILLGLKSFGIHLDEGLTAPGTETGDYGPYVQSKRGGIYQCYVKELIRQGAAYPCFCSEDELNVVREEQEKQKLRTGYYGKYAKCRNLTEDEAIDLINAGKKYVIRFKSPGSEENRMTFEDGIKGKIEMPENDQDLVLLKSDMIPTYHFAHAVDDHLMRTTHVIRGDEWLSSTPIHFQLFKALGFKPPKYAHISPIMKEDPETGGKRKLSKRKDPEAAVKFFVGEGYPEESVIEYLLNIANSDFEDWRRANPKADNKEFRFNLKKMSLSGALFDMIKLNDVSKNVISFMEAGDVYEKAVRWAAEYDQSLHTLLDSDKEYAIKILRIDRGTAKPRKDIAKWSDVKGYCSYFYDTLYTKAKEIPFDKEIVSKVLSSYIDVYNENDDHDAWFERIRDLCEPVGFSPDMKAYKQNPDAYKGHVGDVSTIIRIAVTGRSNSPDLCEIMQLLGRKRVVERLQQHI